MQILAIRKSPFEGAYYFSTREEYKKAQTNLKGSSFRVFEENEADAAVAWVSSPNITAAEEISSLFEKLNNKEVSPVSANTDGLDILNMYAHTRKPDKVWQCPNGHKNDYDTNFCTECGSPRTLEENSAKAESWTCTNGHTNSSETKFCVFCGEKKSETISDSRVTEGTSGWTCTNGHKNDSDVSFCVECGQKKPEAPDNTNNTVSKNGWSCSNGHYNDNDTMFCVECGEKKNTKETSTDLSVDISSEGETNITNTESNDSGWYCSNGHHNDNDTAFCIECGEKRVAETPVDKVDTANNLPTPPQGWTCSNGHHNGDDVSFCMECGERRHNESEDKNTNIVELNPTLDSTQGWTCTNGHKNDNDVAFCVECGQRKPISSDLIDNEVNADSASELNRPIEKIDNGWTCSNGHHNSDDMNFCEECGQKRLDKISDNTNNNIEENPMNVSEESIVSETDISDTNISYDATSNDGWTCTNGHYNTNDVNFCLECGQRKPVNEEQVNDPSSQEISSLKTDNKIDTLSELETIASEKLEDSNQEEPVLDDTTSDNFESESSPINADVNKDEVLTEESPLDIPVNKDKSIKKLKLKDHNLVPNDNIMANKIASMITTMKSAGTILAAIALKSGKNFYFLVNDSYVVEKSKYERWNESWKTQLNDNAIPDIQMQSASIVVGGDMLMIQGVSRNNDILNINPNSIAYIKASEIESICSIYSINKSMANCNPENSGWIIITNKNLYSAIANKID